MTECDPCEEQLVSLNPLFTKWRCNGEPVRLYPKEFKKSNIPQIKGSRVLLALGVRGLRVRSGSKEHSVSQGAWKYKVVPRQDVQILPFPTLLAGVATMIMPSGLKP